jgi:hypothetical protein
MRPASLFEGVAQRLCILISQNAARGTNGIYVGGYRRWSAIERPHLIPQTRYALLPDPPGEAPIPKLSTVLESQLLSKIAGEPLGQFCQKAAEPIFVHRIVRYFVKALTFVPVFRDAQGRKGKSEDYKEFRFDPTERAPITALLNSTLFYWYWRGHSDGFHCGYGDVYAMPYRSIVNSGCRRSLEKQLAKFMKQLEDTSALKKITTKSGQITYQEFYPAAAKRIIDEIDRALAQHFGFTEEELDFVVNYDIKYRLGGGADEDE